MIDVKKIEEAARDYINKNGYFVKYDEDPCVAIELAYKEGAKWAVNEFFKDLFHPASEVPRNDNGKILAFSKVNSNMNAMLNETACYTYQGKWKVRVREYTFTDLAFVEDLLDLIKKGGKHD